MTTIVRQQLENLPRNISTDVLAGWDLPLRDDNGWYDSGAVAVDQAITEWFRVTASMQSEDGDIATNQSMALIVITQTLSGPAVTTATQIADRRSTGTARPGITVSGLVQATVNTTAIGVRVVYGDTTADRDWLLELQVEAA